MVWVPISLDRFFYDRHISMFCFCPHFFFSYLGGQVTGSSRWRRRFSRDSKLISGGVNTIIIFRFFLKVKISPLYYSAYQNPFCDDNTFWKVTKTALKFQGFLFWQDLMYNLFNQKYHHNSPRFFTFCGTTFSNGFHL